MNKSKLKTYAPQARKDFIAAVTARANLLGLSEAGGKLEVAPGERKGDIAIIAGREWPVKLYEQRERLIKHIQTAGFSQTMEAVAYTWFNRFAALRYMEIHDYLDHGHCVLSNRAGGMPEILNHATELDLPGFNKAKAVELKLAGNKDGELYKMLLVAQCNALSRAMPFLFERIDDETELLLPDNLLRTDSIVAKLVEAIPEEDWQEVEIIGWLYQFYISEKKDEVIGKVVKSEDIPAATQLFTPNWIVQYLVQNSVGRLWLMANPASTLKSQWPYYIEPAEQTPEVQAQLDALIQTRIQQDSPRPQAGEGLGERAVGATLNPETITMLDPACGSGHILVVGYDVFKAIYLERGYQLRAIPRLILEKNLYGLDIDDRAAQLAGFALLMKARADDRRLFDNPPKLNVLALQENKGLNADEITQALNTVRAELVEAQSIRQLIDTFAHAKTFGSLIQIPPELNAQLATIAESLQQAIQNGDLYAKAAAQDLLPLVAQAQVLGMQFDAVVANPPYMGFKYYTPTLKEFIYHHFPSGKHDLFSAFINRMNKMLNDGGIISLMTPFTWMFLPSFEELREELLENSVFSSIVKPEYHSFFESAYVPVCAFSTIFLNNKKYRSWYVNLDEFYGADLQPIKLREAIQDKELHWIRTFTNSEVGMVPGKVFALNLSDDALRAFSVFEPISKYASPKQGLKTGNNDKFLRRWFEVNLSEVEFHANSSDTFKWSAEKKWCPIQKGGEKRRWYGNYDFVINWNNNGEELKGYVDESGRQKSRPQGLDFAFKQGATWTTLTVGDFSMRLNPEGFLSESAGSVCYPKDTEDCNYLLAFFCSKVMIYFMRAIAPTLSYSEGNVSKVPLAIGSKNEVNEIAAKAVELAKNDWDSSEMSWDFKRPYFIGFKTYLLKNDCYSAIENFSKARDTLAHLEKLNNRLFIDLYNLSDALDDEVKADEVTLKTPSLIDIVKQLISYSIGCMLGRYSLDEPGLIYAHAGNIGFDATRYQTFPADADGIVPLTDDLWFEDDAANRIREFLLAVWGAETLEENLAWLAESLGKKGNETPIETIRRYLSGHFYKDHLQTYKKRPIYWLFSSGKQGAFQALVYLHRYHEGTLARMRSEYVVPLTGKIQSRIEMLEKDKDAATVTAARNKLNKEIEGLRKKHVELLSYDEKLRHYADMRIQLDLDDGVKVNYGKFGDLLAEVKAVTGGAGDE